MTSRFARRPIQGLLIQVLPKLIKSNARIQPRLGARRLTQQKVVLLQHRNGGRSQF